MVNVIRVVPLVVALMLSAFPPARAAQRVCPDPVRLPPLPFSDVTSAPDGEAVICAGWYDVMRGVTDDRFRPAQAVRRDQLAAVLARTLVAANVPLPSEPPQPFRDVDANTHRHAIAQMAELGLVRGVEHALYEPAAPVRRGQMAASLVRLATQLGVAIPDTGDAFRDDDGSAHEQAINQAVALGLARGVSEVAFAPGRVVRRDQAAAFLARLVEVLVGHGAVKRRPVPSYTSSVMTIPEQMHDQMRGVSWREGCPVSMDQLVLLEVTHWDFNARARRGHLIVAESVADDLANVFREIYLARFQIERMRPIDAYGGDDRASMNDNNTSAFNCRATTAGSGWSEHSYGTAVDINPRQNPYVNGRVVLPASGRPWIDRVPVRRGVITPDGPVTKAFDAISWRWGGTFRSLKDYQHFSASGR